MSNELQESKRILNFAVSIGEALLKNGGEVYRVQETVGRILEAYGILDYNVFVITNGIFATVHEQKADASSMLRYVPIGEINLRRVADINQLSREICSKSCPLEEAYEKLKIYENSPCTKGWVRILACGMGSASFCYLFGGRPYDSILSFFLGMLLEVFLLASTRHHTSKFMVNIIGSFIVTLGSLILYSSGIGILFDKVIIGGIIPLLPGVALTNSIRDLFSGDYLSGGIRLMDALLTAFCIAIGVGAAIKGFQIITGGGLIL
ncbi:MAG: threonine/serine exporter family protein [Lachnospiraceae bacterium]